MRLVALDHVQLAMPAGSEASAQAFYAGVLGLQPIEKPEAMRSTGGAWFRAGSIEIHLGVEDDFRPARKAHPALRVSGLEDFATRCEAAGHPIRWDERYPDVRRFYVADPFGNRLELLEALPATAASESTGAALEIRRATGADLGGVVELYRQLHPTDPPVPRERIAGAWNRLLANPDLHLLLGLVDGMPATSCTLLIVPNLTRGARPYGLVENVVTAVNDRGRGYATRILEHALVCAWEADCYKVMLMTGSQRESTLRLYERVGFERGRKVAWVAYPPSTR